MDSSENKSTGPFGHYVGEFAFVSVATIVVLWASSRYDLLERFYEFSRAHEDWELDEVFILFVSLAFLFGILAVRHAIETVQANKRLVQRREELEKAMERIRQLTGILPICSHCKKIRDDGGSWRQLESYITAHSEADFTHGICPECEQKLYADFLEPGEKPPTKQARPETGK